MPTGKVINIVSGKGGTGKSLLTAVLARALSREGIRVLLVDLDIFVRGLTILLTESGRHPLRPEGLTVSDFLRGNLPADSRESAPLAIQRFLECDLLPAVRNVSDPFELDDQLLSSLDVNREMLGSLVKRLRQDYDLIFLDSRAGLDSMIAVSCEQSDIVLSIAEDDEVSLQANANLLNHLRYLRQVRSIYTIINKGRRIYSYEDLRKGAFRQVEFNYVGVIPFDSDVMEDFGTERFWLTVYETLYFRAAIDAWNNLASRESLKEISERRYRFPPKIFASPRSGRLPLIERIMAVYGLLGVISGVALWFWPRARERVVFPFDVYAIVVVMIGLGLLGFSLLGFRRFLVGPRFPDDERSRKS